MDLDAVQDEQYIREELLLDVANFDYVKRVQANNKAATPAEWANVYTILELAQRWKREWVAPRAHIELWQNIYAAADATQVQVLLDLNEKTATPRWRTFGA